MVVSDAELVSFESEVEAPLEAPLVELQLESVDIVPADEIPFRSPRRPLL